MEEEVLRKSLRVQVLLFQIGFPLLKKQLKRIKKLNLDIENQQIQVINKEL